MRNILKWLAACCLVAMVLVGGGAWWSYRALTATPEFYEQILLTDHTQLADDSQQLESRVSVLVSDAKKPGEWKSTVTAAEINGWLGHKLPESYPEVLPPEIKDPRVLIEPGSLTLAVRTDFSGVESVVTMSIDIYVTDDHLLAVEIKSARAGLFPLPPAQIARDIQQATAKSELPVRWTQTNGRPVMLIDIGEWSDEAGEWRRLTKVELAAGQLYLSGTTTAASPSEPEAASPDAQ